MAEDFEIGAPLPEESSNRTFLIVAGVLGGLLVLSMICLGGYALVIAPRQEEARIAQATEIIQENTRVAQSLTETAQAEDASATPEPSETPTATATEEPTATPTEVVVMPTDTPFTTLSTMEVQTATAAAQMTADAAQGETPTPTPTALPATGFADEAGLPGLLALGAVLVLVLVMARRMRSATV